MLDQLSLNRRLFFGNLKRPEHRIDLGLAALLIAREEYPRLVIEDYVERLDQLAAGLAVEIDIDAGLEAKAETVAAFLAQEHGFECDHEDYYSPRNSYLNEVMDRRLGIPISLSIVYLEVARRVGLQLMPVSMPGHFLVKMINDPGGRSLRATSPRAEEAVFMDPFNRGRLLDVAGCQALFDDLHGGRRQFRESMLGAATKRQVISRVLHNLKSAYVGREDYERALTIIELLTLLAPWDLDEVRDRGLLRYRLGRFEEAIPDLEAYADHAPPGPQVESVRAALRKIGPR